ncbi:MAG: AI-2E family transporter [Hyphomicrobiaceae bacterium]|nr:AI-2E family transporter [Hyphomicrobiaceae bacterium]
MRVEKQLLFWLIALVVVLLVVAALKDILLPFVAAIVIAYFLNPLADALERIGLPRALAAVVIVGIAGVLITLAVVFLGPLVVEQIRQFAANLPGEFDKLRATADELVQIWLGPSFPNLKSVFDKGMDGLSANWSPAVAAVLTSLWSGGLAFVNFVALFLITPVVVFYLIVDWHHMLSQLDQALPRDHAAVIRKLAFDINSAVAAFIRGQGAICLVLGIFYAAGLSWAGLRYGLLVGLTTGLLAFVPVIGWVVGLLTALSLAVVQFGADVTVLAKVAGVLCAGIAIDTAFLSPRLVGQKIGLHPVWLLFALFVFSYLFGLVGTLIAVPLAAAASVLIRFAINMYLASALYRGVEVVAVPPGAVRPQEVAHD